jgi:hypothetical protein
LRPFQPEDAEYFYGRDAQIDEVVERLRQSRFVAVIGGSGSGKSSLVLAGAIPRLRSFAIYEAGDLWIPVISTPGTNHIGGDTPLRRLARKFCAVLKEVDAPRERLEHCVALLRQPNGLSEMVTRFGRDLRDSDWVDLRIAEVQVNFLFLIDQFEEIFHPTNVKPEVARDCTELVNRIVEQFNSRHKQICVAITMRSEHLNDCTRYQDLPDAINETAYLVKRLDPGQFRDAIARPAMRFLRKCVAEEANDWSGASTEQPAASAVQWPEQIAFEPRLVERLRRDSEGVLALHDHADYLPLLQHLLFWIWKAASDRCGGQPVPDMLRIADLTVAVLGRDRSGEAGETLDEKLNSLTECFENQCECIFGQYKDRQERWEEVFRSLSFKDPNTGTYTQQRASMGELCNRPRIALPDSSSLEADLKPWIDPHPYLHWDVDSQTVKVAHETLIRRWERFRKWTDDEDRQFQAYLRLLENCALWVENQQKAEYLSEGSSLRRYEDVDLPNALRDPGIVDRFARLLAMHRDRRRLAPHAALALQFVEASLEERARRERERADAEAKRKRIEEQIVETRRRAELDQATSRERIARERQRRYWIIGVCVVGFCLVVAEWMLSGKERTLHRGYALASETQVITQPEFPNLDSAQLPLRMALTGAYYYENGEDSWSGPARLFPFTLLYRSRLDGLENTMLLGEGRNISTLRAVLQDAVWPVKKPTELMSWDSVEQKQVRLSENHAGPPLSEPRFYRNPLKPGKVLITSQDPQSITVLVGDELTGGTVRPSNVLIATPPGEAVDVGIAADLSNLVLEFKDYVQVYAVLWDSPGRVEVRRRVTISKDKDGQPSLARSGEARDKAVRLRHLRTAPADFATDVVMGQQTFRMFALEPSSVEQLPSAGTLLTKTQENSVCGEFEKTIRKKYRELQAKAQASQTPAKEQMKASSNMESPERLRVWELSAGRGDGRTYCLQVAPAPTGTPTTLLATLYGFRDRTHVSDTTKYVPLQGDIVLGATEPTEFRMDAAQGWIAFKHSDGRWRAMPWSLTAWRGLAKAAFEPGRADKNPDEGQRLKLPYNLILGTDRKNVPNDEALRDALPTPAKMPIRTFSVGASK